MSTIYARGKHALGICDICGCQFKLHDLKEVYVKGRPTGVLACRYDWDEENPQEELGRYPIYDPQALRNPRPDSNEYPGCRGIKMMPTAMTITTFIGAITVSAS